MYILIAADHAGFVLKSHLIEHLIELNLPYRDLGTNSSTSVDYPDYAHLLCNILGVATGILICGTGVGMAMAANRHPTIRCAVATSVEMAQLARQHNDANVIALGARLIDTPTAIAIIDTFLNTPYEGGRHDRRIQKIELSQA